VLRPARERIAAGDDTEEWACADRHPVHGGLGAAGEALGPRGLEPDARQRGEALLGGGGEEVELVGLRGEVHDGAVLAVHPGADPGDDVLVQAGVLRGAVQERVRAELLDHSDLHRQPVIREVEGLWPDAEHHRLVVTGFRQQAPLDRDVVADLGAAVGDLGLDQVHCRRAHEPGDEHVLGSVVEAQWRVDLLQSAVLQDGDAVAHRHGLDLVVRHVDGSDVQAVLEFGDLGAGLDAELGVEVGQWLVHQEDLWVPDDGAAHGDALTLATGEGLRFAVEVLLDAEQLGSLVDAFGPLLVVDALHLEGEAHVVRDRHVRVERVVLEHHRDVPLLWWKVGDVAVADVDLAFVDFFEAGEHPQ
jgi:hypothetical protein